MSSHLAFQLSRLGNHTLFIQDMDNYEAINLAGQFTTEKSIGQNKAKFTGYMLNEFSPGFEVFPLTKAYDENSMTHEIMLTGLDNLETRKLAFDKWKNSYKDSKDAIFMDGRLLANEWQIITIQGCNYEQIERYEKEFFFTKEETTPIACTFKQTTFCAAQIASFMVSILTNWLVLQKSTDLELDSIYYKVPFYLSLNTETLIFDIQMK